MCSEVRLTQVKNFGKPSQNFPMTFGVLLAYADIGCPLSVQFNIIEGLALLVYFVESRLSQKWTAATWFVTDLIFS